MVNMQVGTFKERVLVGASLNNLNVDVLVHQCQN